MNRTKVISAFTVNQTYLKQHNSIRMKPGSKWVRATAEQWFGFENPGLVWQTSMPILLFVSFYRLDWFSHGKPEARILKPWEPCWWCKLKDLK